MNKDEFLKRVNDLRYSRGYCESSSWEKEQGFKDCKEKVLALIPELDIEGMTPNTFELFRNAMTDLTNNYQQLFQLQKELQIAQQTIIDLQRQLIHQEDKGE